MNEFTEERTSRGKIFLRFVCTLICLVLFHVLQFVIEALGLVQYAILFVTKTYSEPLRVFLNRAAAYSYRLIRYITLNENTRPFPFSDFPPEMDPPEEPVRFD